MRHSLVAALTFATVAVVSTLAVIAFVHAETLRANAEYSLKPNQSAADGLEACKDLATRSAMERAGMAISSDSYLHRAELNGKMSEDFQDTIRSHVEAIVSRRLISWPEQRGNVVLCEIEVSYDPKELRDLIKRRLVEKPDSTWSADPTVPLRSAAQVKAVIKIGMTKKEVLDLLGKPRAITFAGSTWDYGGLTVVFHPQSHLVSML